MAADTLSHSSHEVQGTEANWSGASSPFKTSYGKIMMWYFLLSDAFTFASFLIAYGALRFSSVTWPIPDFVFSTAPFGIHNLPIFGGKAPLIFVTFMSFLLIASSVTMVRAVQEGHRENKNGVVFWMILTIIGGLGFLGSQAWEWTNLIAHENMTITTNPFGTYAEDGTYLNEDGSLSDESFKKGEGYLLHKIGAGHGHEDGHSIYHGAGDYPDATVDEKGFIHRKYKTADGEIKTQSFGPKAFGALFFFITGFHGFHVFSGIVFLIIICINAASGLYVKRKNGYEMVEKIGLYWHFVDLVWVFVFLAFYLL